MRSHSTELSTPRPRRFVFGADIENILPTRQLPDGTVNRVDEMAGIDFYIRWREGLGLVKDLDLEYLRIGPPYFKTRLEHEKKKRPVLCD